MEEAPSSQRGAFLAKLGAWLQLAPVLGIMFGMSEAFSILRTSGAGDPARLTAAIGDVITYMIIAASMALVGLILVTIAITFFRYRAGWLFYFLCLFGLLMIGLNACLFIFSSYVLTWNFAFGLFFLIFAAVKKHEFQRAAKAAHKLPSCYNLDA